MVDKTEVNRRARGVVDVKGAPYVVLVREFLVHFLLKIRFYCIPQ